MRRQVIALYSDVIYRSQRQTVPTWVIWGETNKIYDIRGADRLQRCLPRSTVVRSPNAGHLLLMENADTAATLYLRFLAKIPVAAPN